MELIKASVTAVSPLTVKIDGASSSIIANLLAGLPVAGATCWLLFPPGKQPPLVVIPGKAVDSDLLDGIDSSGFAQVKPGSYAYCDTGGANTSPPANTDYTLPMVSRTPDNGAHTVAVYSDGVGLTVREPGLYACNLVMTFSQVAAITAIVLSAGGTAAVYRGSNDAMASLSTVRALNAGDTIRCIVNVPAGSAVGGGFYLWPIMTAHRLGQLV